MLNAAPPSGPRGGSAQRGGRGPRRGGPSRGAISKRSGPRGVKTDKDGDLDMDAPVRYSRGGSALSSRGEAKGGRLPRGSASGGTRSGTNRPYTRGSGLVEITVLGWQESQGNRDSVIDFLERKTNVRIKKVCFPHCSRLPFTA